MSNFLGTKLAKMAIDIVWFKRDLRIFDHSPLSLAAKNGTILPVFIFEPELWKKPDHSYRHYMFLKEALNDLEKQLQSVGANLTVMVGHAVDIFDKLNSQYKIKTIFSYEETWNLWTYNRDKAVRSWARANKVEWIETPKNGVVRKLGDRNGWSRRWYATMSATLSYPPNKIESITVRSDNIPEASHLNLSTQQACSTQIATRLQAINTLNSFLHSRGQNYTFEMSSPITAENSCSRISPYLAFGQIHVETIWEETQKIERKSNGYRKYINELGWREFSHSLINYFPQMLKGNLRKEFDKFPWQNNKKHLNAWKQGLTGYPIVDAGMRELYETGWMHNRVRMITASFLVKHLRINWTEGEKFFRDSLLDFNEANNVAGWQWVAGCGADAAPYFRIFNPILQGEKFDPEGNYVKKWVPEISNLPKEFLHKPWELNISIKGFELGKTYPKPIVIHEEARNEALKAFKSIKK